ncbi:hypothetical protein TNCV_3405991 [Trichonephila clavipes]|nr:hypothetical protein TNCV_3405991 [Trichonephila clavipes]
MNSVLTCPESHKVLLKNRHHITKNVFEISQITEQLFAGLRRGLPHNQTMANRSDEELQKSNGDEDIPTKSQG